MGSPWLGERARAYIEVLKDDLNRKEKNYSLLIRGGRLIDPAAKIDATMDVLLRDGQVAEIAPPGKTRGTAHEKIDARGLIVAPGFIDLHVHSARTGAGLQGNHRYRHGCRRCRRIHFRLLHAQYAAGCRLSGMGHVAAAAGAGRGGERVSDRGRDPCQQRRGPD